jgi:hypothetical protein
MEQTQRCLMKKYFERKALIREVDEVQNDEYELLDRGDKREENED